jgi:hypothetical protein
MIRLNNLSLKDRGIFREYLRFSERELAAYAFENIYIWEKLYNIKWAIIEANLCVFFRDKLGCFLYLAPLGEKINPAAVEAAFYIMDRTNKNKEISRIENVQEKDFGLLSQLGLDCKPKPGDYIYAREGLAALAGGRFKSQRASFNYFRKNYISEFMDLRREDKDTCLKLYDSWARQKSAKIKDNLYQGLIQDSRRVLQAALNSYKELGLSGKLIKINSQTKAFTFGYPLNASTFCILYEITDLSLKGLAQFIFAQFCRSLQQYKYINIMDDSGLKNLRKVKLSWRPLRLAPAYIAKRKNAQGY